jgi:hypothetical protein
MSTLRTVLRAIGYDFSFEQMFAKLSSPMYSGASSCDNLEIALDAEASFERNLAQYALIRWEALDGEVDVPAESSPRSVSTVA